MSVSTETCPSVQGESIQSQTLALAERIANTITSLSDKSDDIQSRIVDLERQIKSLDDRQENVDEAIGTLDELQASVGHLSDKTDERFNELRYDFEQLSLSSPATARRNFKFRLEQHQRDCSDDLTVFSEKCGKVYNIVSGCAICVADIDDTVREVNHLWEEHEELREEITTLGDLVQSLMATLTDPSDSLSDVPVDDLLQDISVDDSASDNHSQTDVPDDPRSNKSTVLSTNDTTDIFVGNRVQYTLGKRTIVGVVEEMDEINHRVRVRSERTNKLLKPVSLDRLELIPSDEEPAESPDVAQDGTANTSPAQPLPTRKDSLSADVSPDDVLGLRMADLLARADDPVNALAAFVNRLRADGNVALVQALADITATTLQPM